MNASAVAARKVANRFARSDVKPALNHAVRMYLESDYALTAALTINVQMHTARRRNAERAIKAAGLDLDRIRSQFRAEVAGR